MVSPQFPLEKLKDGDIDDWIDIFEDRIITWVLTPARFLIEYHHGYYAMTHLLSSYFEGVMQYVKGQDSKGKSKTFFQEGFVEVFRLYGFTNGTEEPENWEDCISRVADKVYEFARCGFFHDGMFRGQVFFAPYDSTDFPDAISIKFEHKEGKPDPWGEIESVAFNAKQLLYAVETHFKNYILSLRNEKNVEKRNKFEELFKQKMRIGESS